MKNIRLWFCSKVISFIAWADRYADTEDKKKYLDEQKEFFSKR